MTATRVVLADDHQVMRESIRYLLEATADIKVVGEASNGLEALDLVEKLSPDVLLLDLEMPGLKGIEVAQRLHDTESAVRVLVLSAYDDKHYIEALLATGAPGYLIKGGPSQTLIKAVRGVAKGEQGWVSQQKKFS
jgi:DNA-binding NarL/FixJ family response regulator